MTAAAKILSDPTVGRPPGFDAVRKAEAWGQGEVLLALEVAANAIAEARILSGDEGGLKRRLAPSSNADREGRGPTPTHYVGAWTSYALSTASPSSMAANTEQR
jgi:hypothetical protein